MASFGNLQLVNDGSANVTKRSVPPLQPQVLAAPAMKMMVFANKFVPSARFEVGLAQSIGFRAYQVRTMPEPRHVLIAYRRTN